MNLVTRSDHMPVNMSLTFNSTYNYTSQATTNKEIFKYNFDFTHEYRVLLPDSVPEIGSDSVTLDEISNNLLHVIKSVARKLKMM